MNGKQRYLYHVIMVCFAICWLTSCGLLSGSADQLSVEPSTPASGGAAVDSASSSVGTATDITVDPQALHIAPGSTYALSVRVTLNGQVTDITREAGVSYRSSAVEIVTVSDDGMISAVATASTGSEASVEVSYHGLRTLVHVDVMASLVATVKPQPDSIPVITNPQDMGLLVNKKRALPADFIPTDLVDLNVPFAFEGKSEKRMLRAEAAQALEALFAAASEDDIHLIGVSGYRSYATQRSVYQYNVKTQGEREASRVSAQPGQSEHQSGLAIDVSSKSNGYALTPSFADTPEGQWLAAHAPEFGFIIRYPKGQEEITGYSYEPWHIRYVGLQLSQDITTSGLTFEQYYEQVQAVSSAP